jgi:hypothetical protein
MIVFMKIRPARQYCSAYPLVVALLRQLIVMFGFLLC